MQLLENDGSGNLIPRISLIEAVACGKFKMAGQLIASSIVLNGPAPTFFAPWIYRYFIGGIQHLLKDIPNAIPETTGLSRSYNKIQHIEDTNKLQKFMMTDEGLDILTEIGYIGVPSKVTLESKQQILRSIFTKEIIQKTLPALEQLTEGMELYGLLRLMRQNEHVFRFVFCQNDKMKWTFDKIDSLLLPMYNTEGSNAKAREIDTYKAFVEALEEFSETGEPLTIDEFMKFLTGSSTLPPIGLPNDIKVEFVHSCVPNCKCKPSISACCISISLAVHYKEVEEMKNALKDAVQLSYGFDDL